MASTKVRLDSKGLAGVLAGPKVAAETSKLGRAVASNAGGETAGGEPIPVKTRTRIAQGGRLSARTAVDVSLAHPAGLRVEAMRGTLVRAASAAGLEVKGR